ncbi:MAG: protein kinase [Bacteroidetes bacterium]|nr:protein kinase [Bacteroidota bacterium]
MAEVQLFDNKYEFVKELGRGGFGKVFLAKENISNRYVAIKELLNKDEENQQDIIREIQTVARFNHPNIVTYHHHFVQEEQLFLVMEYCSSGSLRDILKEKKTDVSKVLQWIQCLTGALQFVHEKGIIHHDIKPENILFTDNEVIKISDFGIANTGGGTRAYMSPDALFWERQSVKDARVDIYALGVTLLELLTGKNPFSFLSREQIIQLHDKIDFPINQLPNWQQEIILKAINKTPELRFQSMNEFAEAIKAKAVPIIFMKDNIKAGDLAEKAEKALRTKKWLKVGSYLDYAERNFPENVNVLKVYGKYYLRHNKIKKAKEYFEKALRLNPRLDIQKDLGWINLELKNYPSAISLLSDHLHRTPTDYEAYNLLLRCYYETNRYEAAIELAKTILDTNKNLSCFANNSYICSAIQYIGENIYPSDELRVKNNPFIDYNISVVNEEEPTHSFEEDPTLKSKLLFMDYHFNNLSRSTLYILDTTDPHGKIGETDKTIIKIGREGYSCNDLNVSGGTAISRRHCVIINMKNDVWIYDLDSTGTYLNGERIFKKASLIGLNILRIGNIEYTITTDKTKLL